jgi:hypothetical protein
MPLQTNGGPDFSPPEVTRGRFPWPPLIVALAIVLAGGAAIVVISHRNAAKQVQFGSQQAPADPYAASLAITGVAVSQAAAFAGNTATYVDGTITNNGSKTVDGAQVQVAFLDSTGAVAERDTVPLLVVRTKQPSVDTITLAQSPLKPGQTVDFRLVFDHVSDGWNQAAPGLTVVQTSLR